MDPAKPRLDAVGIAFTEAVVKEFGYLQDIGLARTREEPRLVRYESGCCFVNLYQSRISSEIKLQVGQMADRASAFDLGDLERAFRAPYIGAGTTDDAEIVGRLVARLAERVRPYLTEAVTGGDVSFQRLKQARRVGKKALGVRAVQTRQSRLGIPSWPTCGV